jgi:hypothetical protein
MASPGGYIQSLLETAPNAEGGANAVSSNIFYLPGTSIEIDPNMTPLERNDELRGGFYAAPHSGAAEYNPAGSLDGRCYPGILGQLLFAACGSCTTTAGNGVITDPDSATVPASAYRHVFAFKTTDVPQTLQLTYAPPSGGFWKAQGVAVDELAFKADNGAQTFAAKLLALVAKQISDPSLTPSYETAGPWRAGELALTWLSGSAITKDFDWSIKNGLKAERQFTTNSRYPDSIIYDAPLPVVGGSIPKRAFDSDDWTALTAGTTFAAMIKYVHSEFATGTYKHKLWVEMPACQYITGKQEPITNKRRTEATFDWEARYDTATSKWCTITLVNATPAYATYA